jgi:hypothetical protein
MGGNALSSDENYNPLSFKSLFSKQNEIAISRQRAYKIAVAESAELSLLIKCFGRI